jgi:hypothetical protein
MKDFIVGCYYFRRIDIGFVVSDLNSCVVKFVVNDRDVLRNGKRTSRRWQLTNMQQLADFGQFTSLASVVAAIATMGS